MAATKTVSIVTGGSNNAATSATDLNALATDFIANGVVGAISLNTGSGGTGSLAVNAQGTPNMSVRISAGQGYVSATPLGGTSQKIRFAADTFEDITIAANSTGGTRYDWVYASIDATKLANPGVNKDDVFTYVTSRSTSSATDNGTPPTYGYNLAVVTVVNGASSITNSNITDNRTQTGASAVASGAGVGNAQLSTGVLVQQSYSISGAAATGTTIIPWDDTLPQNTEGDQYMSVTHTPKSTTNILEIEVMATMSNSVSGARLAGAIFQDSGANALAVGNVNISAATEQDVLSVKHIMVAGTTSATTFKFRAGSHLAGTTTFNGDSGVRKYGGAMMSTMIVREYKG